MELHGQTLWYLHKVPSYAKSSEGYPPLAASAGPSMLGYVRDSVALCAFIHRHSPCLDAEVQFLAFFLYGSSGTHPLKGVVFSADGQKE